jgi:hypothetical protein
MMAAPKFKTSALASLYKAQPPVQSDDQNLRDKQKIEALTKRLNDMIQKDSGKKAATILEQWLNPKKK